MNNYITEFIELIASIAILIIILLSITWFTPEWGLINYDPSNNKKELIKWIESY